MGARSSVPIAPPEWNWSFGASKPSIGAATPSPPLAANGSHVAAATGTRKLKLILSSRLGEEASWAKMRARRANAKHGFVMHAYFH